VARTASPEATTRKPTTRFTRLAGVGAFLLATVGVLVAGCGGDQNADKTFHGSGFSITYPGDWSEVHYTNQPSSQIPAAVAISYPRQGTSGSDSVSVTVAPDQTEITAENVEGAVDDVTALAREAYERLDTGPTVVTVGDLPAVRFEASDPNSDGGPLYFRTELVFDGTTWYAIQCEFKQEGAEKIRPGCDQVMASFRVE